jgi:hypothetical protein
VDGNKPSRGIKGVYRNRVFDLVTLLSDSLHESKPNKGNLYAGSHLIGSLRHAMLDVVNAPKKPTSLVSEITMKTGDFWHEWANEQLRAIGWPFMSEVRLSDYLPEGWAGRADWVIFDPTSGGFVLGDMKTITGEGLTWINRQGAKEAHIWQVSAYWHALYDMGLPMVKGFFVLYWPKNAVKGTEILPSVQDVDILDRELVYAQMESRWDAVKEYIASLNLPSFGEILPERYLTSKLAPPIERVQKVVWNAKQEAFDLKLVPHWTTAYCDYEDSLCDCSNQGETKIGSYDLDGNYSPRSDSYADIRPAIRPTDYQLRAKRRAVENASGNRR